jgi:hypothetical protein
MIRRIRTFPCLDLSKGIPAPLPICANDVRTQPNSTERKMGHTFSGIVPGRMHPLRAFAGRQAIRQQVISFAVVAGPTGTKFGRLGHTDLLPTRGSPLSQVAK